MIECVRDYTLTKHDGQRSLIYDLVLNNIEGDIVELGCGTGKNTRIFAETLKKHDRSNMIYGFDTFTGYTQDDLSETKEKFHSDIIGGLLENQDSKRWHIDESVVHRNLKGFEDTVKIIAGDIKETTKNFVPKSKKISMLYIDCNIYGASKAGIDNLQKYFSDGCLVVTDTGFYPPPADLCGEHEALLEYHQESKNPMYRTHFGDYIAFFVEVKK